MKHFWIALLVFTYLPCELLSQGNLPAPKLVPYRVWVKPVSGQTFRGAIYSVTDSSIIFLRTDRFYTPESPQINLMIGEIEKVRARKINQPGRYTLRGALIGLGVGAIIGALSYSPCENGGPSFDCLNLVKSRGASAGIGATLGVYLGAGAGLIIGSKREAFPMRGRMENYITQRERLSKLGVEQN